MLARTAGISLGYNPLCMGQAWVLEYAPLDGCTQCGRLQKEMRLRPGAVEDGLVWDGAWVLKHAPLDGCAQCGRLQKENHAR